ncbi:MAG: DivIVA-like cell division protein Wag31 [Pseudonocardia sp.]
MPLTPADVHNVAFSKPPIGKRGYNEDEVDAFLDLIEAELSRLIEENTDLREQVERLEQQLDNAQADLDSARSAVRAPVQPPPPPPVESPPTAAIQRPIEVPRQQMPAQPLSMLGDSDMGGDPHVGAAKVLGLAQEMADRLTAEAKVEADRVLTDARTRSERLLSESRAKSDGLVNEARTRAETMLNDARTRAETLDRQSREKASTLEREMQRKHNEIVGTIQRDKSVLEKKVDELRTFEREYRTRLKTYLESQLRDLEGRGSAAPADGRSNANQGYAASGYGPRADAGS